MYFHFCDETTKNEDQLILIETIWSSSAILTPSGLPEPTSLGGGALIRPPASHMLSIVGPVSPAIDGGIG